ncbi:hypothetical protein BCV69DRAFT_37706 [Microstroma glucosiphilum]|uniref:Uncharacterized protein n=1 Tax=Pseudomicrostroma glucosiphilum TaxID=1684307 RepID=A0A316U3I8_9BASI|nr:hypothetical protein BCV69DRAFT_37706 [Pseudomicrostroma glucosiphilum]PWN19388.1 hypothetical protein BCV69DRAFT_37706 [Pseudomicrostroma glucosiphilum]
MHTTATIHIHFPLFTRRLLSPHSAYPAFLPYRSHPRPQISSTPTDLIRIHRSYPLSQVPSAPQIAQALLLSSLSADNPHPQPASTPPGLSAGLTGRRGACQVPLAHRFHSSTESQSPTESHLPTGISRPQESVAHRYHSPTDITRLPFPSAHGSTPSTTALLPTSRFLFHKATTRGSLCSGPLLLFYTRPQVLLTHRPHLQTDLSLAHRFSSSQMPFIHSLPTESTAPRSHLPAPQVPLRRRSSFLMVSMCPQIPFDHRSHSNTGPILPSLPTELTRTQLRPGDRYQSPTGPIPPQVSLVHRSHSPTGVTRSQVPLPHSLYIAP